MSPVFIRLLLVLTIWTILQCGLGSAFNIEVATNQIFGTTQSQVTISCIPDASYQQNKEIIVLQVGKTGDKPIVVLRQNSKALEYGVGMKSNFLASGNLNLNNNRTFMTLTMTNPDLADVGSYTCMTYYLDPPGNLLTDRASANITLDNLGIEQKIDYLIEKVSGLENRNGLLEKKLKEQNDYLHNQVIGQDKVQKQIQTINKALEDDRDSQNNTMEEYRKYQDNWNQNHVTVVKEIKQTIAKQYGGQQKQLLKQSSQVSAIKRQFDNLDNMVKNQTDHLNDLQEKDRYVCAFSAGYNGTASFLQHDGIVFSEVYTSIGGGYNPETGIFTAPRDGLYVFHLVVMYYDKSDWLYVDLVANNKTVATVWAHDKYYWDQSAGSTAVILRTGHVVKPVVNTRSTGARTLYPNDEFSVFTGYLVKLL